MVTFTGTSSCHGVPHSVFSCRTSFVSTSKRRSPVAWQSQLFSCIFCLSFSVRPSVVSHFALTLLCVKESVHRSAAVSAWGWSWNKSRLGITIGLLPHSWSQHRVCGPCVVMCTLVMGYWKHLGPFIVQVQSREGNPEPPRPPQPCLQLLTSNKLVSGCMDEWTIKGSLFTFSCLWYSEPILSKWPKSKPFKTLNIVPLHLIQQYNSHLLLLVFITFVATIGI